MKKNWQINRISEIATIKPSKSEARKRVAANSLVSFMPMEDLEIDAKYSEPKQTKRLDDVVGSYTYFAEGDVLLAKITPCFENGKLGIAKGLKNGVGFGSSEFLVIRPNDLVSNEWLYYFLLREDFRDEGAQRMGGAVGHQRVPKEFVEGCAIPIPPLAEQRRIVGVLDEAFAGLAVAQANTEKNLQNARTLFESQLHDIFINRGKGWPETTVGDICEFRGGGTPSKAIAKYWQGTIPWVSPKDMKCEVVLDSQDHISPEAVESSATNMIPKNSVLMVVRSGILARIVPLAITGRDLAINQDLKALCPLDAVEARFLYSLLESKMAELLAMVSRGATVHRLMSDQIRSLKCHLPPKREQLRIIDQVDEMRAETQRLTRLHEQKNAELVALKKSLLHQAFNGEL